MSAPYCNGRGRGWGAGATRGIRTGCARVRRRRLVVVLEPFDICAAVAFELGFYPVDGSAIAIRSLAPIAELRQPLDGGLVPFQIKATDESLHWICNSLCLAWCAGSRAGSCGCKWQETGHK